MQNDTGTWIADRVLEILMQDSAPEIIGLDAIHTAVRKAVEEYWLSLD